MRRQRSRGRLIRGGFQEWASRHQEREFDFGSRSVAVRLVSVKGQEHLPGCQGRVEEGIEQHRQLGMLLAHNFQQDHTSIQLQFLQVSFTFPSLKTRLTVLLDSTENVVDVVREESLCVKHRLNHPGDCLQSHRLVVCVFIPLLVSFILRVS